MNHTHALYRNPVIEQQKRYMRQTFELLKWMKTGPRVGAALKSERLTSTGTDAQSRDDEAVAAVNGDVHAGRCSMSPIRMSALAAFCRRQRRFESRRRLSKRHSCVCEISRRQEWAVSLAERLTSFFPRTATPGGAHQFASSPFRNHQ
ncbi:hypothetical protein EVAR_21283_1 [Eumeta japonica]|uniref:Uncharacterized protein n=1 Tax=Eumeta variegata TaxID=151549 RepID=A0A4C1WNQ2_EUMVA|nr:hypothetical protein EVAR_21283_1 [Eumeta japonica]